MSQTQRNHGFAVWLVAAFLFLAVVGAAVIYYAPKFFMLEQVTVTAGKSPTILGYDSLGQKSGYFSADQQHLKVRYSDKSQMWLVSNVAPNKKVLATLKDGTTTFLRVWRLQQGDRLTLENNRLTVTSVNPLRFNVVALDTNTTQDVTWQNGVLTAENEVNYGGCNTVWWKRLVRTEKSFTLGGQVQCATRLKLAGIPLRSAAIVQDDYGYYLRPLRQDVHITMQQANSQRVYRADQIEHSAANITQMIMGRTVYRVAQTTGTQAQFALKPVAHFHLFESVPEFDQAANPNLSLKWSDQANWLGKLNSQLNLSPKSLLVLAFALGIAFIVGVFISAARHQVMGERKRWSAIMMYMPCALLLWVGFALVTDVAYQLACVWLSWAWLTIAMMQQRILSWDLSRLWLFTVLIAGIGLLTQVQLAAGAESTRWLQYPNRHIQYMLLVPMILMPLVLLPTQVLQIIWRYLTTSKLAKMVLLGGIALALLVQFIAGDEKGIFGFQPVELTKTVLVFMFAGFAVNWFHLRQVNALSARNNLGKQLTFFGWVILLALVVYVVVLGGVRDFSPILITLGLLMAFIWVVVKLPHLPASKTAWLVRSMVVLGLLAVIGLGLFIVADPSRAQLLSWLPQSDRISLWASPWNYPDTGRQLQLALEAVHGGSKELTTNNWFGVQWFGLNGGRLLSIPAIQDDFILAFYLHKWGGAAGIALLLLQAFWVMAMFGVSQQLLIDAEKRNRDQRLSYRFLAYVVYGMAWMHVLHWLISWGNTLGILPIMGQPMTWLSSGMSHLLAVALPSLILMLLATRFNR